MRRSPNETKKYSNEELERIYLDACNRAGKWIPLYPEYLRKSGVSVSPKTYFSRYKTANNLRSIIEEKYKKDIKFSSINRRKIKDENEFYEIFINESVKLGFKIDYRNIIAHTNLPSASSILIRFGKLKDIHKECSLRSKNFTQLPEPPIKKRSNKRLTKNDVAIEYINKCLLFGRVYSANNKSFAKLGTSFSTSAIKTRFQSMKNFYDYCRKISPEYDKLFKDSNLYKKQNNKKLTTVGF